MDIIVCLGIIEPGPMIIEGSRNLVMDRISFYDMVTWHAQEEYMRFNRWKLHSEIEIRRMSVLP